MSNDRARLGSLRRWCRFSLWTLLIVVTLFAVGLTLILPSQRQRQTVAWLRELGATVSYDYEPEVPLVPREDTAPPGTAWIRNLLGVDFYADVVRVDLTTSGTFGPVPVADFGDQDVERLLAFPKLRELALTGTQITDAAISHLQRLPHLRSVWLDRTNVSDAALELLAGRNHIEIYLPNCHVASIITSDGVRIEIDIPAQDDEQRPILTANMFGRLRNVRQVHALTIQAPLYVEFPSAAAWRFSAQSLDELARFDQLEVLALEGIQITPREIAALSRLPKLRQLYLGQHTANTVEAQRTLPTLTNLERLDIDIDGVQDWSWIAHMTQLRSLGIDDHSRATCVPFDLAQLRPLHRLETLRLSRLWKDGDWQVGPLPELRQLKRLEVHEERLCSDADRERLSRLLPGVSVGAGSFLMDEYFPPDRPAPADIIFCVRPPVDLSGASSP